ncbi:uncharacterized protein [Nicotiana tomentosiformis]|uniref:uncharacterized protein n=1 Tax=Nicotiana tomentosiformis TaxID=4098 RepID=UPI00388CB3D4
MARELEIDISYQEVVSIPRILEGVLAREREERDAKRSPESGTHSGTRDPGARRRGRGYRSRPIHLMFPAVSGIPVPYRPQEPYYAPPVSSAPPARGAFSCQSSRPCPSQSQKSCPPRACFKCGDTRHMVKDCPRLRRGAPPRTSQPPCAPPGPQAMIPAPSTAPPSQPAQGGGRGGRGRPRGGGQARYYALPARKEAVSSDSVITGIVPVCHRDPSILFDQGSSYSYASS